MSNNFSFQIPNISNFETSYYFSDESILHPPKKFPFHMHDMLEVYILVEGDVSFAVEGSLYRLSPGDAIITKPNEMHNCILNTQSVHRHLCFWFDISSSFLFSDFTSHDFGRNNLIVPDERAKAKLAEVYKELRKASDDEDTQKQFYLVLEILYTLRQHISSAAESQMLPDVLSRILSDIDENFRNIPKTEYITNKYFISPSTLNRLFKTHLHTTPKKYIEMKKLAHSRLLLKSGKSVLCACMESGFADYSNYIRLFKRCFSMTPKQYQDGRPQTE